MTPYRRLSPKELAQRKAAAAASARKRRMRHKVGSYNKRVESHGTRSSEALRSAAVSARTSGDYDRATRLQRAAAVDRRNVLGRKNRGKQDWKRMGRELNIVRGPTMGWSQRFEDEDKARAEVKRNVKDRKRDQRGSVPTPGRRPLTEQEKYDATEARKRKLRRIVRR